jgi:uncharacterized SAM-binding protein YcdF (DUF218 family)
LQFKACVETCDAGVSPRLARLRKKSLLCGLLLFFSCGVAVEPACHLYLWDPKRNQLYKQALVDGPSNKGIPAPTPSHSNVGTVAVATVIDVCGFGRVVTQPYVTQLCEA